MLTSGPNYEAEMHWVSGPKYEAGHVSLRSDCEAEMQAAQQLGNANTFVEASLGSAESAKPVSRKSG